MPRGLLPLLLAVVLLVVVGGGAVVVKFVNDKSEVRRQLRAAAERHGVDPDIADAIGYVESRWRRNAVNNTGADAARGGSYGPTQISMKTARAYGFTGQPEDLFDPATAAEWTGIILAARPGGPPTTVEDAAAWWNAGRTSFAAVPATNTARTVYAPALAEAYGIVRFNSPNDQAEVA